MIPLSITKNQAGMQAPSFIESFYIQFYHLGRKLKRLFLYFQRWFQRHPHSVHPGYASIAEELDIDETTVYRGIKLFRQNGWLCWKRRAYTSNLYFMDEKLINLDLKNVVHKLSKKPLSPRQNAGIHAGIPVSTPSLSVKDINTEDCGNVHNFQDPQLEKELNTLPIKEPEKRQLRRFGWSTLQKAKKSFVEFASNNILTKPAIALITYFCNYHHQKEKQMKISYDPAHRTFRGMEHEEIAQWKRNYPLADLEKEGMAMIKWVHQHHKGQYQDDYRVFILKWLHKANQRAAGQPPHPIIKRNRNDKSKTI